MRSTVTGLRAGLLVGVMGLIVSSAAGQPTTPLQDSAPPARDALIQRLLASVGGDYELARDSVLAFPSDQQAFLVSILRSHGPRSRGAMVASFIEVRATYPDLAAEFDRRLQEQIEHPHTGGITPEPIYRAWLPQEMHIDPLVIEAIVLRPDLPDGLGSSLAGRLRGRPNPTLIDLLMGATDHGWPGAASFILGVCREAPEHHARVAEFLNDFYRRSREAGRLGLIGVVSPLLQLAGPARLAEVRSLIAWERELMPAQGFRPWDEEDVGGELVDLSGRRRTLHRELAVARETGTDRQLLARLEAELAAVDIELETLVPRWEAQALWGTLVRTEARLAAEAERDAATGSR